MPERLTESLIRRGQLTKRRADEATKRQVLMGGALDTSLLELGHVDEDHLVEGMAAAYGLATANPRHARADRDERALRAFPEQWAQKHLLAPLTFDDESNTLSVLSPAPADVNLIVRLGELLEVTIRPLLAPEFRVQERIAFLYNREAPERFAVLIDQHRRDDVAAPEAETVTAVKPYIPEAEPEAATKTLTFGEAVSKLREAEGRDEIVEVTLRYAIRDLQHASVFINHDDGLEGWQGYGPGGDRVPKLHVELSPESAFRVVLDTLAHYLGPLPKDPAHATFLAALGRPHPRAVLIVPIRIRNRTIALLYGENGQDPIPPRIATDLMLFITQVQVALSELLLKRKAETLSELTRAEDPIQAELLPPEGETPDDVLGPPTIPMRAITPTNGSNGAVTGVVDDDEEIAIEEATPYVESDVAIEEPVEAPGHKSANGWEPVDVDGLDDLGNELDQTIAAAQAALESDSGPPAPTTPIVDPFSNGSIFGNENMEHAVVAESSDGQHLLQELDDIEDQLTSDMPPPISVSGPDEADGWESVDVDHTWDGDAADSSPIASTLRSSLTEDATVPDLSAEAWLRASSETTRARPLPPEVMERAAMPATPDPLPLTRLTIGQDEPSPPTVELDGVLDAEDAFDMEPVPLTHRTSSVVSAAPLVADDEEPVPLTKLSTTATHSARPVAATLPESSSPFSFDEEIGPSNLERLEPDHVVDAMGRLVPVAESQITPPAPLTDPTTRPSHLPRESSGPPSFENQVRLHVAALDSENESERQAAIDELMRDGPGALPMIGEAFPGPLLVDPFTPEASNLPPFAKCGPLLSILERHGRDAHPYVAKFLDAPDPLARFFAIYFYAAVYVPEAIPRLIQRLHDEESRICMLGARTLFAYREHPDFAQVLDHLHGRLAATSLTARRHATYLIGLFRDVTAIPHLIDVLDQKEKGMLDVAEDALAEITKQRFGHAPKKWRAWWSKNEPKSRIEWLIEGLAAKEPVLRRSAAEELRAVTGLDMGYDEEAPKRQREDAKKRWHDWWVSQSEAQA